MKAVFTNCITLAVVSPQSFTELNDSVNVNLSGRVID